MKKAFIFIGAILLLGFSSLCLAEIKIGVLDVNKVLTSVPQVKKMQTDLKKEFDPRGNEIVKMQNAFVADIDKYRKSNVNKKGDELLKEQQKLIEENRKLQEARVNFQRDLVTTQNRALGPILRQVETVVEKIAKEKKLNLVLTKMSTVYSEAQFEITDQVIAEMGKTVINAPSNAPAKR